MNCFLIFLMAALTAQPAEEWNALTNQNSGWLGADGVYSAKNPADGSLRYDLRNDSRQWTAFQRHLHGQPFLLV